jgi:hypothetical protein
MKIFRHTFFVALLFLSTGVYAFDTYRFGDRIVEVGDSASKLIELAGEPILKEPVENEHGALKGERWQYVRDDLTVTFLIKDGKVSSIEQARN